MEKTQKVNFFSMSLCRNSVPFLLPDRQLTHGKWETRYSESSATNYRMRDGTSRQMLQKKVKSKTQIASL